MPGFLYFIPGDVSQPSRELLARHGLAHAVDGTRWAWSSCRQGPGGGPGLIVADSGSTPAERVRYSAAAQTWRKMPNLEAGRWKLEAPPWLGYFNGELPGPDDLKRPVMLDGYWITLGDGRPWIVPIALEAAEADPPKRPGCALPRRMDLDDSGAWTPGEVLPEYRALSELAAAHYDACGGYEGMLAQRDEDYSAAVAVLAHNYRLSAAEAAALGLFHAGRGHAANVLRACCDWLGYWEIKKKAASDTSDSPDGPAGSTGDDAPPLPT